MEVDLRNGADGVRIGYKRNLASVSYMEVFSESSMFCII